MQRALKRLDGTELMGKRIRLTEVCLVTVEPRFNSVKGLGKFVRYIEGLLYRKPRYNEFVEKPPKCLLYRGIVTVKRPQPGHPRTFGQSETDP